MASGRPDWYGSMTMHGLHAGNYIPVALDNLGNMIAQMKGWDGADLKTILTDAAGRMISILYDPVNDRYVAIDADGYLTAVLKGVDGATLRTVAVDADGMIEANLSRQDLSFLTVRPAYGEAVRNASSKAIPDSTETQLFIVNDQGILSTGMFLVSDTATRSLFSIRVKIDGVYAVSLNFGDLWSYRQLGGCGYVLGLTRYDEVNFEYAVAIQKPLTFESSVEILCYHAYGVNVTIYWDCIYALTP